MNTIDIHVHAYIQLAHAACVRAPKRARLLPAKVVLYKNVKDSTVHRYKTRMHTVKSLKLTKQTTCGNLYFNAW